MHDLTLKMCWESGEVQEWVGGVGLSVDSQVVLPYSRKYWRSIKFGGLAVGEATVKFKSVKFKFDLRDIPYYFTRVRARIYMYGTTAKFKSANIFILAARDQTAKLKIANISGYTV